MLATARACWAKANMSNWVGSAVQYFDGRTLCTDRVAGTAQARPCAFRAARRVAIATTYPQLGLFTARRINKRIGCSGPLCSVINLIVSRVIRPISQTGVRYIRRNPAKARLCAGEYALY